MQITVQGTSQVSAHPERATVRLKVSYESATMADATTQVKRSAALVYQELADLEKERPSPITWFSVDPLRTRSWQPSSSSGVGKPMRYLAWIEASIKFQDFKRLAQLTRKWADQTDTHVTGITWALTDKSRERLEHDSLRNAVKDAERRAQGMATAAGAGTVIFMELADPGMLGVTSESGGFTYGSRMAHSGDEDLAVVPEDIDVKAHVHARFEA